MSISTTSAKKPKPPVSVKLSDDLEEFLRQRAKEGFRSLSMEIKMRLEWSRQAPGGAHEKQA
ncbi:hypothetical protein ABE501_18620 [Comamonas testosteroni]